MWRRDARSGAYFSGAFRCGPLLRKRRNAMTDTTELGLTDPNPPLEAAIEGYAERLLMTGLAGMEAMTIALGRNLGLYAALDALGSADAQGLGNAAGIAPRYAREWLEQVAAGRPRAG